MCSLCVLTSACFWCVPACLLTYRSRAATLACSNGGSAFEVGALLRLDIVGSVLSVQVEDGSYVDFLDFLEEVRNSAGPGGGR